MSISQASSAARRMYEEYSDKPSCWCSNCCNYQSSPEANGAKVCIAYSAWKKWDPNTHACGLYNTAFRGLTPKRRPLGDLYEKRPVNTLGQEPETQFNLFDSSTARMGAVK